MSGCWCKFGGYQGGAIINAFWCVEPCWVFAEMRKFASLYGAHVEIDKQSTFVLRFFVQKSRPPYSLSRGHLMNSPNFPRCGRKHFDKNVETLLTQNADLCLTPQHALHLTMFSIIYSSICMYIWRQRHNNSQWKRTFA